MHDALILLGGMVYGGIAGRATYVVLLARRRRGLEDSKFIAGFFGLLWIGTLPMLGFLIGLSGDSGIFNSSLPSQQSNTST